MEELKNAFHNYQFQWEPSIYRTERAEIVADFVKNINFIRLGTKYKPVTPKQIALRLNMNPKLKSDQEARYLLNECLRKNSFSMFFYCCPLR